MDTREDKKIQCLECKKWFIHLTSHVTTHKLNTKDYLVKYPGASLMTSEYKEKHRQNSIKRYTGENSEVWKKKAVNRRFDFVNNKKLSSLLQRDYGSAKVSLKNKLWKPSIILYGSIIEAILVEKHPRSVDFSEAIVLSLKSDDITEMESHKIHLVRDLRNFVHLHKELSEGGEINEYWARTLADMCEKLIKRFSLVRS